MNLSSSNSAKRLDISRDVDVLIKRIRRKYPQFQYWRMITDEGNGVIHLLYTGNYIPKSWIKSNWYSIHKSYIVDISEVRSNKKMANYLVGHYLANHNCSYTRMSMSKNWIFQGAVSKWKSICKHVKQRYYYNEIHSKYYQHKKEVPFKLILKTMTDIWNDVLYKHSFTQIDITSYSL